MSRFTIPATHPALAGHFPGNPVVPAVVILASVQQLLMATGFGVAAGGIRRAKFLRRLLPGEEVELSWGEPRDGLLRFRCQVGGELLAEGQWSLI